MRTLVWAIALVWVAGAVRAQPPVAVDWLDRMARAGTDLSYSGTVVYRRDDVISDMRLVHVGAPDGPLDRVQALEGFYWELRRNPVGANLLLPAGSPVGTINCPFGGNFSAEIPRRLQNARGLYRLVESGKSRIAGRVVQQLDAIPVDPYRYGLSLAVDEDSGLLVRVKLLGANGQPTEQARYTLIEFLDTPDARARGRALATAAVDESLRAYPLTPEIRRSAWSARWLPPGFTLRNAAVPVPEQGQVEHLLYSDGMAALSVFIEPLDPAADAFEGPAQSGSVGAFGAVLSGRQVTVMGGVPELTLRRVGENLEPDDTAQPMQPAVQTAH